MSKFGSLTFGVFSLILLYQKVRGFPFYFYVDFFSGLRTFNVSVKERIFLRRVVEIVSSTFRGWIFVATGN